MITLQGLIAWLKALAEVYTGHKEYLTELDAAIGDADHGTNMARGFTAVDAALDANPVNDVQALFRLVSMTLIKTVGGSSGPLFGTFFMKMALNLPAGAESISLAQFCEACDAGVSGMCVIGKSHVGEKTMLDALVPALTAMKAAVAADKPSKEAFASMVAAAEEGMKATIPMLATKGRASYLGERSIGHQDPGATSVYLMLNTMAGML
ncbi:MAG: dihydroxyacetone kinase subunit L [Deferribacteraceae bacterium]|jgi:dihydroxyacetone kinase-like protein|nr:dihydroxyacetone kinase subunit L [Deferribacteraceae bacterium]